MTHLTWLILIVALPLSVTGIFFALKIKSRHQLPGSSRIWYLDRKRRTEIISNRRLGSLQRHTDLGGALCDADKIIVWAKEFLDDDILYKDVLENIKHGVSYFYVLDRKHSDNFKNLLTRLYDDTKEKNVVNKLIDVIFVRQELTLNNFVVFSYGTAREVAYSALIYDELPFAWVRQSSGRSSALVSGLKSLLAGLAIVQAVEGGRTIPASNADDLRFFLPNDQIMDYRNLGNMLIDAKQFDPRTAHFDLEDAVKEVLMPNDAGNKIAEIVKAVEAEAAA